MDNPEPTELPPGEACGQGGTALPEGAATAQEERQVVDIPAIRIEVTAHRAEIKICPGCGAANRGVFPAGVTGRVQDGPGVKPWAAYFQSQHVVPVARTAQIVEDLLNHRLAEATLIKAGQALSSGVEPATEAVKTQWRQAEVWPTAEAGLRVKGQRHGLPVAAPDRLTDYEVPAHRGQAALDEAGILPDFQGTGRQDHGKAYCGSEDCPHALGNAHPLRELPFREKQEGQAWAAELADWLLEIKQTVGNTRAPSPGLPPELRGEFERRYDRIISAGYEANPRPPPEEDEHQPKKRGRPPPPPPLNLLDRRRDFKPPVLAGRYDFRVPFDNNWAEQDGRRVKVKQKVSGCFRTLAGATDFARIRGAISTARKNTVNVFRAIRDAFCGKPFIPSSIPP